MIKTIAEAIQQPNVVKVMMAMKHKDECKKPQDHMLVIDICRVTGLSRPTVANAMFTLAQLDFIRIEKLYSTKYQYLSDEGKEVRDKIKELIKKPKEVDKKWQKKNYMI